MCWYLVSCRHEALRLGGRSGFGLRLCFLRGLRAVVLRPALRLRLRLALLLPLPPPAPGAAGGGLRRGQVVGERVRDLLDRAEPLASRVDQLVRPRGVALRRGEQRRADLARLVECCVDELRRVLLVPVAPGVGQRAQESLGLRELAARAPVLHLARRPREAPCPAREDLLGRVRLVVAQRA